MSETNDEDWWIQFHLEKRGRFRRAFYQAIESEPPEIKIILERVFSQALLVEVQESNEILAQRDRIKNTTI